MNTELLPIDTETVDRTIGQLFPTQKVPGFSELFGRLLSGEFATAEFTEIILETIRQSLFGGIKELRSVFILALAMAFFFLLARSEKQGPAAEAGFFVTYLLTVSELFVQYRNSAQVVGNALNALTEFLKVFLPVYCTGLATAAGTGSATAFYGAAFFGITAAGMVFEQLVLPLTGLYFMTAVFDRLFREEVLSRLAKLFLGAAGVLLKLCIGAILGIGSVRGMLAPSLDGLKRSGLMRAAGAIPVFGDLFDGATQTVLAAGGLVKNAIGAAGAVFVFLICIFPALKLGVTCVLLKIGAAVLQPISDKRIGDCLEVSAKTHKMLFRILMYSMFLFLILILIFAAFTGIGGKN